MAKVGTPVVGFNLNVKYGGRDYHVQTEDSGLPHAHYITHLFLGGNIVSSVKTSYADKVEEPELPKLVRQLMETQTKAMLRRLVSGEFNDLAERFATPHYAPGVLADGQTSPGAVNTAATAAAPAASLVGALPAKPRTPSKPELAPAPAARAAPAAPAPAAARPPAVPAAPAKIPTPVAPPPARAPATPAWQPSPPAASAPPRMPGAPLPPTTRVPPPPAPVRAAPPRMAPPLATPTGTRPAPAAPPPQAARQAPSIFADDSKPLEAPHEDLPTLFAEELISEKSLDEVILAFLSADLEPPK